jgi:hypothetical protein
VRETLSAASRIKRHSVGPDNGPRRKEGDRPRWEAKASQTHQKFAAPRFFIADFFIARRFSRRYTPKNRRSRSNSAPAFAQAPASG